MQKDILNEISEIEKIVEKKEKNIFKDTVIIYYLLFIF